MQLAHTLWDALERDDYHIRFSSSSQGLDADLIAKWQATLRARELGYQDRLLLLCDAHVATLAAALAAWSLGSVVCPLPHDTPQSALEAIARDCGAAAIVEPAAQQVRALGGARHVRHVFLSPPEITAVDLALIIYTSGSTGHPKGIMLSQANVLAALRSLSAYLGLRRDDMILSFPPLHFDYGLYQGLLALSHDCAAVFAPPGVNALKMLALIEEVRPTVLPVVPALAAAVAKLAQSLGRRFDSVRLITNTGGHLPQPVIAALREVFPAAQVMPMYGLTESKRALFMPPQDVNLRPGSVGKAMPGLTAKVMVQVDSGPDGALAAQPCERYRETAPGEVGELWVRGPSVMQGYTDAAAAGARLLPGAYRDDNWLATGDLFCRDEDGYLYFKGRSKDLIKQAGYCLYPKDIEQVASQHPDLIDVAVVGVEAEDGTEYACLYARGDAGLSTAELHAWLKQRLPAPYVPRQVKVIDEWPLNKNGKIDRRQLAMRSAVGGQ